MKLEEVAINNALPLKAARHDAIAKLKSFGLRIWAADKLNSVSFRFAVSATLMLPRAAVWWTGDGTEYRGWVKTLVLF